MVVIAKTMGTICTNVVLIFRSVPIRLRAIVGVYEEAIEGEIASCMERNQSSLPD